MIEERWFKELGGSFIYAKKINGRPSIEPCGTPQMIFSVLHCVKSVQMRSYFWSVYVNLRIQSEHRKIRPRNNSVDGHFSRSISI